MAAQGQPLFSRIVVTGDLLRPFLVSGEWESATWKNIRWLHALLGPSLAPLNLPVTTLAWDDRAAPGTCERFDTPGLYHRLGQDLSLHSWAFLASRKQAPDGLVEALRAPLSEALVIGYEMPDSVIDALQRLGRPFIDVILHPLRFLPDLVFALRTNVPDFHRHLVAHRLSEAAVARQAGLIQAKAAWMAPPASIPPGSVLVLGQVSSDRAMVQPDGRFAQMEDHLARLHRLCCDHPCVLFKAHPYEAAGTGASGTVRRLPAIVHTRANFYHLLAQPEIEGVVALNSSGLVEARAFGRRGENLLPFLYDFERERAPDTNGPGDPVALTSAWTEPGFWRRLLDPGLAAPGSDAIGASPPWTPNALRRSMNADWGYSFIEKVCA